MKNKFLALALIAFLALSCSVLISTNVQADNFSNWLSVEESNARDVISTITLPALPQPQIIQGEDGIEYKLFDYGIGFSFLEDEGKPRLPVEYVWFQIPDDAQNINVEVLDSQSNIKGNVLIYPTPHSYFEVGEEGFPIEVQQFTKNEELYAQNSFYPETPVAVAETAFLRQVKMARVAIHPIIFNPQEQKIKHYRFLRIKLTYNSAKRNNQVSVDPTDPSHKIFQDILPNYSYIEEPSGGSGSDEVEGTVFVLTQQNIVNPAGPHIDYLMICADSFCGDTYSSVSPGLINLATNYTLHPYNIGIVSVSNIYAQYPAISHEQSIKNFIQFAYGHWKVDPLIPYLKFILLVGDADWQPFAATLLPNWFLPLWRSNAPPQWGGGEQNMWSGSASDNDYACVSGIDEIPDLMLGRFPVKDETELNNMVSKTIYFETHSLSGQNHWGTRNLYLAGSNQNEPATPPVNLARDMLIAHHQDTKEYNYNDSYNYYEWQWDSGTVTGYLNDTEEGGALMVIYNGHGSIEQTNPVIDTLNLNNIYQQPAIFFSFSCDNGAFDICNISNYQEIINCNAENWIKADSDRGAVACFASSRVASGSWDYSDDILNIIYDEQNYLLGSIIQEAKVNIINAITEKRRFNLLGDPGLNFSNHIGVCTKPELYSVSLSMSNTTPSPGEQITISVTINQNQGLSEANNVLMRFYQEVDGQLVQIGNDFFVNVAPAENTIVEVPWVYDGVPFSHFVVKINPDNAVPELSNYNNHLASNTFSFCFGSIYVDDSNLGMENGSPAHPFNTILEAMDYINANRLDNQMITVYVMEGSYSGYPNLPSYVHLKGFGNIENIILRDPICSIGFDLNSITVEHLTIDLGNPLLRSNQFWGTNINIIGNIFRNCGFGISAGDWDGNYILTIKNNTFYNNGQAIHIGFDSGNVDIINNTIINNNILISQEGYISSEVLNFFNNIMRQNGPLNLAPSLTLNGDYNDTDNQTILNLGQHDIDADPLFIDPANHNYHLQLNSPCIDAGDPNPIYNDPANPSNPGMAKYPALGTIRNDMGIYGGPWTLPSQTKIMMPFNGLSASNSVPYPCTAIDLSWVDVLGEDGYRIWRSTSYTFPEDPIATLGPNVISYIDSGLLANTHYYYKLTAYNQLGSSYPTYTDICTHGLPPTPGSFNAVPHSVNLDWEIDLSWSNVQYEQGYIIWRSTTPNIFIDVPLVTLGLNVTSYTDCDDISANTHYYYMLKSYNEAGNSGPIYTDTQTGGSSDGPGP